MRFVHRDTVDIVHVNLWRHNDDIVQLDVMFVKQ